MENKSQTTLINKDPITSVIKSMNSYFELKQPECSFYSEDGHEIPVHKELFSQTKLLQS